MIHNHFLRKNAFNLATLLIGLIVGQNTTPLNAQIKTECNPELKYEKQGLVGCFHPLLYSILKRFAENAKKFQRGGLVRRDCRIDCFFLAHEESARIFK